MTFSYLALFPSMDQAEKLPSWIITAVHTPKLICHVLSRGVQLSVSPLRLFTYIGSPICTCAGTCAWHLFSVKWLFRSHWLLFYFYFYLSGSEFLAFLSRWTTAISPLKVLHFEVHSAAELQWDTDVKVKGVEGFETSPCPSCYLGKTTHVSAHKIHLSSLTRSATY